MPVIKLPVHGFMIIILRKNINTKEHARVQLQPGPKRRRNPADSSGFPLHRAGAIPRSSSRSS